MRTNLITCLCFLTIFCAATAGANQDTCNGKAKDCKGPVKFVGNKPPNCICFACRSGSRGQYIVCTTNEVDQKALLKMADLDSKKRQRDAKR